MKRWYLMMILSICVWQYVLFAATPTSSDDWLEAAFKDSRDMAAMPSPKELPKLVVGLSEEEQKWVTQWIDDGLLSTARDEGMYSAPLNGLLMRYKTGCPESQMRYILKQLYHTPPPTVAKQTHGSILNAMISCKDQTVIDIGYAIACTEMKDCSRYMVVTLADLHGPEILTEMIAYLKSTDGTPEQKYLIFRTLWYKIPNYSNKDGQQLLDILKNLALTDDTIGNYMTKLPGKMDKTSSMAAINTITLADLQEAKAIRARNGIQSNLHEDNRISYESIYGIAPWFIAYDQFFLKNDQYWKSSLERFLCLKQIHENPLDWYSDKMVKYIAEEYAKLAPKFADKEKALAEAEAAYIAKYPDLAPVPIAK